MLVARRPLFVYLLGRSLILKTQYGFTQAIADIVRKHAAPGANMVRNAMLSETQRQLVMLYACTSKDRRSEAMRQEREKHHFMSTLFDNMCARYSVPASKELLADRSEFIKDLDRAHKMGPHPQAQRFFRYLRTIRRGGSKHPRWSEIVVGLRLGRGDTARQHFLDEAGFRYSTTDDDSGPFDIDYLTYASEGTDNKDKLLAEISSHMRHIRDSVCDELQRQHGKDNPRAQPVFLAVASGLALLVGYLGDASIAISQEPVISSLLPASSPRSKR